MKSKIKTEVHTHTSVSAHAYTTTLELIQTCLKKEIELLALTNHAPSIPDGAHHWHFENLKDLPRKINNLYLLRGAEVNIINYRGHVDLTDSLLSRLDWVIASIHRPCLPPGTKEDHTEAYIGALKNPYIDVIGHSGTPAYEYDIEAVVETAKQYDKVIELNNHSFTNRQKSIENCEKIARACAKIGTKVSISTDAHDVFDIGNTEAAWQLAMDAGIKEEQIVNVTAEGLLVYLARRKGWELSRFESPAATL